MRWCAVLRERARAGVALQSPQRAHKVCGIWTCVERCTERDGTTQSAKGVAIIFPPLQFHGATYLYQTVRLMQTQAVRIQC